MPLRQNCVESSEFGVLYPQFQCSAPGPYPLDASVTNPSVWYEWKIINDGGQPSYIYGPTVEIDEKIPSSLYFSEVTLTITNLNNGCEVVETFLLLHGWEIRAVNQLPSPRPAGISEPESFADKNMTNELTPDLRTLIYPNPSDSDTTFYYEISSSEILEGTIEIYSPTGALIYQTSIAGKSTYKLPFDLALSSGIYLVVTKVNGIILTEKLLIN